MKFIIYRRLLQPVIASPGASYYTIAVIIVDHNHLVQKCLGAQQCGIPSFCKTISSIPYAWRSGRMFLMRISSKEGPTCARTPRELRCPPVCRPSILLQHLLPIGWSRIVATHISLIQTNLLQLWLNEPCDLVQRTVFSTCTFGKKQEDFWLECGNRS